jgi:hypothetical protein
MTRVTSHLVNVGSDTRISTINCLDSVDSSLSSPTSSNQFSYLLPNNLSSVIAVFVSSPLLGCEVFCWFPATNAKLILLPQQVQGSWIRERVALPTTGACPALFIALGALGLWMGCCAIRRRFAFTTPNCCLVSCLKC